MERALFFLILATSIFCSTYSRNVQERNCLELKQKNVLSNGVYTIKPCESMPRKTIEVYCDMETDDGGWTIIQRRDNFTEQTNFKRSWEDYADGFGSVEKDFWIGNDVIHCLTSQLPTTVRFDLEDFEGQTAWAKYSTFSVDNKDNLYQLEVTGYTGNAGDSFPSRHNGMKFSTIDNDNDVYGGDCAQDFKGGWWYGACHYSNLNGLYLQGAHSSYADGVNWYHWKGYQYSLKKTEIKIRGTGNLPSWTTDAPPTTTPPVTTGNNSTTSDQNYQQMTTTSDQNYQHMTTTPRATGHSSTTSDQNYQNMTTTYPAIGDKCSTADQTYQHGESWNQHCRDLTCIDGQVMSALNNTCCQSGSTDYSNGSSWYHHCQLFKCHNGAARVIGKDPRCGNCQDQRCSQDGGFCTNCRESCNGRIIMNACTGKNCVCCIPRCSMKCVEPDY